MALGDSLRQGEDEALVLIDLLRRRLGLEQLDGVANVLQALLLQLLDRVVAGAVELGLALVVSELFVEEFFAAPNSQF